jgi:hypothetical protein
MTIIERATFETSKTCVPIHGADEVPKRCDPLHGGKINRGMIECKFDEVPKGEDREMCTVKST